MKDRIEELVDWQIASRPTRETIHHVCRVCLAWWTGSPKVCPECEVVQ